MIANEGGDRIAEMQAAAGKEREKMAATIKEKEEIISTLNKAQQQQ